MYSGICLCLLLAVLSASSSGQQPSGSHNANPAITDLEQTLVENHRHARTPASGGQLKSVPRVDGNVDPKANLGALLARYLQQVRRGSPGKVSAMGLQSFDPTHRIKDRDYMGWMDFGRRSAEEYEYSS
ncbi:cholecystokinin [Eublepharis macularius]|uniref:Cholecystokinin n=1 Tax=Eublepharis macularius TaxID=481883 RepID=A0AA97K2J6_EUBMA|nr:cholecystokinin [Eublepharis macularius]